MRTNANDDLLEFFGTEQYWKASPYNSLMLTDGAKAFFDRNKCYWFLDIICSYQPELPHKHMDGFQVWEITRLDGDSALITCEDGNYNRIIEQKIDFTDFPYMKGTLWIEDNIILLPTEH